MNIEIKELKNNGYIKSPWDDENYALGDGSIEETIVNPSGDWTSALPETEQQAIQFDTFNCTSFGTTNAVEIQHKFRYGEEINFSDRYLGIKAGTKPPGNDPHTVAEAARNEGLIPEKFLPFSPELKNANEYFSFEGGNKEECEIEAKKIKSEYKFGHDWVQRTNGVITNESLQYALQRGTVCIAIYAFASNGYNYIRPKGAPDTHWTELPLLKIGENGEKVIFDSYPPFVKTLSADFPIYSAKRYLWRKKTEEEKADEEEKKIGILSQILEAMRQLLVVMGLLVEKRKQAIIEAEKEEAVSDTKIEPNPPETNDLPPKKGILIERWAKAIKEQEGYGTFKAPTITKNLNPGALRNSPFQMGIRNGYAFFRTYEDGWRSLIYQLTIACDGRSKVYRPEMNLLQFFKKYSPKEDGNDPVKYAIVVANKMNVKLETPIKEFLI